MLDGGSFSRGCFFPHDTVEAHFCFLPTANSFKDISSTISLVVCALRSGGFWSGLSEKFFVRVDGPAVAGAHRG